MRDDHADGRLAGRQCLQPGDGLGAVTRTDGGEDLVPGAVVVDCVRDIGQ
jgi:hypothetical protein